jgi:hypothetical protein
MKKLFFLLAFLFIGLLGFAQKNGVISGKSPILTEISRCLVQQSN